MSIDRYVGTHADILTNMHTSLYMFHLVIERWSTYLPIVWPICSGYLMLI